MTEHHPIKQIELLYMMEDYINLPRIIKAIQITPLLARLYMEGGVILPKNVRCYECARIEDQIKSFVLEFKLEKEDGGSGVLHASFGDWIAQGTHGEWYPISNRVFEFKYAKYTTEVQDG